MEYRVIWSIDLDANSFEEAATIASEIQRDPNSIATHFIVVAETGEVRQIGLQNK